MNYQQSSDFFSFWQKVRDYPLPKDEEIGSILQNSKAEEVPLEVILACINTICNQVYRMRYLANHGIELPDLVSAAALGIMLGLHRYSPKKGKFKQFVIFLARSYIRREIERHLNFSSAELKIRLSKGLDLDPTDSLTKVLSEDDNGQLLLQDVIPSREDSNYHITLDVNNLLDTLRAKNTGLHPLAAEVIELRYSISKRKGHKTLSLSEVAARLNMSKEGIRKIEKKAISYLKTKSCRTGASG
ncbi:MAG TPA: hypothetical protein DEE98_04575 [Elusimicrobia bacterium]|nr:MAG: hypothetical protein A2278_04265 [Elusimicrobia bacterium RIFOXYA12_FULL_49_49]OGS09775.1 MAG: hypothetical protein A2204_01225 [Elusimicrobia bacterium RIFOXYA1_FULL_47_7]OGS10511.1 MAG: hypothetical protein A2386_05405 [Elusimicrobia bacterium RIFOXYB1_FULL_48_9]OGS14735.1 MAG: hypothetical protein A2251_09580 [Elusimicrobia bacterium RIFOXYA2_FULL_47_53]OGS25613.1 MAG: hypothetical protein A2339_06010 [Elusimicrobia bacterium RIFOXYB12_FULL_50_12]OGS31826.1 MAG: hypothetical protein